MGNTHMDDEYIRRPCICQVVLKNESFHRVPHNTVCPATGKLTCGPSRAGKRAHVVNTSLSHGNAGTALQKKQFKSISYGTTP